MRCGSLSLFLFASALLVSSLALKLPKRTRERMELRGVGPEEIRILDNVTDTLVGFHPNFVCPPGTKCEITLEIQDMTCTPPTPDSTDPTYIWFYPLTALGHQEDFPDDYTNEHRAWKCEDFHGDEHQRMSTLENFDLTSVLIVPTGSTWKTGESSVRLFAKITTGGAEFRYIDTSDLHDLYVYLLKMFLATTLLTLLLVLGIVFLFAQKMDSIGQRMRRQVQGHAVNPLPPNYTSLGGNLDKGQRMGY